MTYTCPKNPCPGRRRAAVRVRAQRRRPRQAQGSCGYVSVARVWDWHLRGGADPPPFPLLSSWDVLHAARDGAPQRLFHAPASRRGLPLVGPARGAPLMVRVARFRTALCTTHVPCCLADPRRATRARTAARADAGSSSALFMPTDLTCLALRECLEHAFTPRTILTHALGDALAPTGNPRCDPAP